MAHKVPVEEAYRKMEPLLDKFFRRYNDLFSAEDMAGVFAHFGMRLPVNEVEEILECHPLLFPLESGLYITKSGAFTGEVFSIKPTREEFEQGVLVPGDRCMPFVDSEVLSYSLNFYINGKKLPKKSGSFDSDLAIDMHVLYGEEYAPQYIAADPANKDLNLSAREFELPARVNLTGVDMAPLVEKYGLTEDDRLLCCVSDWDKGKVNLMVVHGSGNKFDQGEAGEKRLEWYTLLEKFLLESFEKRGPLGSIEEQIADVFFEHRRELCVDCCGSVEEFINRYARKVGLEYFGVETRLWFKGQEVPAVGNWNKADLSDSARRIENAELNKKIVYSLPDYVIDQYVTDMLYLREDNLDALSERVLPKECCTDPDFEKGLLLHLQERRDILSASYNWFADQKLGEVRHTALELYGRVSLLVYKIDCGGDTLETFPQQELIILSQLYSHLLHILESMEDSDTPESEVDSLLLSLEGMNWNFEDIQGALERAVEAEQVNRFKVLK